MSTFGLRQESRPEEEEEDELLAALSSEELRQLERDLAELDDDVPTGLRQRDQIAGAPTARVPTAGAPTARVPTARDQTAGDQTAGDPTARDPTAGAPTARDPTARVPTARALTAGDQTAGDPTARDPTAGAPTARDPTARAPTARALTARDPTARVPTARDQTARDQTARAQTARALTARAPAGRFDRDALLRYWEDENRKLLEDERTEGRPDNSGGERGTEAAGKTLDGDRKKNPQKGKKAKEDEAEKKDEREKESPARSKCPQEKSPSRGSKSDPRRTETAGGNPDATSDATSDAASGNPTAAAVAETLERVRRDDPAVTGVNLNNVEDVSRDTLLRFAEALRGNTHVRAFSLANTRADDRVALAVAEMLRENRCVRSLNIESNFVSGQGVLALLAALRRNRTLAELRFHNQRHMCGGRVEMEMVQLLRENTTLLKLGYRFDLAGPRMAATGILTRNQDRQRQRRLRQKEEPSPPEASGQGPGSSAANGPPKKTSQSSETVEDQKRNPPLPPPPPPSSSDPPTRKISEIVKRHEGSNATKTQPNQRKTKSKKLKNGANEKESADILKDLKNGLKPAAPQTRRDEPDRLPTTTPPSSRDDLMSAIRESSIGSLKRVDLSHA